MTSYTFTFEMSFIYVKYKAGIKKRQNQYKSNRILKKDKVSIIVGQSQY